MICFNRRDVQRGKDKAKANRDVAEAAAAAAAATKKHAEAEEAGEEYERAPRQRMHGKGSAADAERRAEPLPVKLGGRLVYRRPGQPAQDDVAVAQVGGRHGACLIGRTSPGQASHMKIASKFFFASTTCQEYAACMLAW